MKFTVDRDALADAVAWTARSLPARPTAPVLAGLLLEVEASTLKISGFDLEVSTLLWTQLCCPLRPPTPALIRFI